MPSSSLFVLIAALPLAFAAPHSRQAAFDGCSVVYVDPTRSSSSTVVSEPVVTPSPLSEPSSTKPTVTMSPQDPRVSPDSDKAADTVKAMFSASTTWDFGALSALPTDSFWVSKDFIGSSPLTHTFKESNVAVEDGFLILNVPGGQAGSDISSGEVSTLFDVKYASVRTWAILTEEPGVCNGMFLFESDMQETDIEWISDPNSQSNKFANNGTRAMQYTNQALNGDPEDASSLFGRAPGDATAAVHEYRLDWFEDRTEFFVDGVFQHRLTENVPNVAGPWVWNNWGNGNPNWTADPPKNDAPFKIQKIEMYYNPA